ncbi:MAG TPA: DUF4129 domain-containing protein [Verrucomicrobiae bacterium]|nr:DUF4129 domain-containing protein [Verrucomicrobiae bacterium]
MKPPRIEKSGLELCDEALFLLRNLSASAWTIYLIGTGPFLIGLLYFWTDMTRGFVSEDRLVSGALGLSVLFVWMKTCQSVFARHMWTRMSGVEGLRGGAREWLRIAMAQSRIQPWGMLLIPMAMVIGVPFAWVYAYFQNATVIGVTQPGQSLHSVAFAQAKLWPRQNHIGLGSISALGTIICVDVLILLFLAPQLLITFFGVKEIFKPSPWLLANTTFLTLVFSLSYVAFDPLVKAFYTLRCFYGQSLTTGEDLIARLAVVKAARPVKEIARLAKVAALLFFAVCSLSGAEPAKALTADELDRSISETLESSEYNWRLPREAIGTEKGGWLKSFFTGIARWLGDAIQTSLEWIGKKLAALLRRVMPSSAPDVGSFSLPSVGEVMLLLLILLTLAAIFYWVKIWRWPKKKIHPEQATATAIPDLTREDVTADQLPDDQWLALATKLAGEGELRLAIRALFLSALATLAGRQWITLAIFKSNRDYERELRRRAASVPQALSAFGVLTSIYNRIWYGLHEPSPEMVAQCQEHLRVLKS